MPSRRIVIQAAGLVLVLIGLGRHVVRRNEEQSWILANDVSRKGEALEARRVEGAERGAADKQLAFVVSRRLSAGVPPDPSLQAHFTALYAAVRYELPLTAQTLVDAGADVNRQSFGTATPLWAARMNKDSAMIRQLKRAGAKE